ncbi:MAG: hypothetical protein ABIX28_14040 [Vicinamibacterales bacterium]
MESNNTDAPEITATILHARIDATKEVIRRSRLTFLVSIVISLSLFAASFNAHWSWYRDWTLDNDQFSRTPVIEALQQTVYEEWAKSRFITIAPLGVQVGSRDAVFLGSLTLLIISAWSFGCVRRHTYSIRQLLLDTGDAVLDVRRGIYHATVCQRLYGEVPAVKEPLRRLDGVVEQHGSPRRLDGLVRLLPFLPAATIIVLVVMDVQSLLFIRAPLRDGHKPLIKTLCDTASRLQKEARTSTMLDCESGMLRATWQLLIADDPLVSAQRGSAWKAVRSLIAVALFAIPTAWLGKRTYYLEESVDADLGTYHTPLYPEISVTDWEEPRPGGNQGDAVDKGGTISRE